MPSGEVVRYGEKGWGFIKPDGGGRDIFMYIGDVEEEYREVIRQGDQVSYDVVQGDRGPRAVHIRLTQSSQAVKFAPPPDVAGECDVLTEGELRQEIETALSSVTEGLVEIARRHGWVDG